MKKTIDSSEIFEIPEKMSVFTDPKTQAKTIALPFQFPDGSNGIVMVSRLSATPFTPFKVLEKITIKFK